MRFTSRTTRRGVLADMTPMIDVVMQLIIFFMYTAQYTQVTRTPMELPDEPGEQVTLESRNEVVIDINKDGVYLVDRNEIPFEYLTRMINAEVGRSTSPTGVEVLIRAHKDCPARHLNELATTLSELGVRSWRLATSEQTPGGSRE